MPAASWDGPLGLSPSRQVDPGLSQGGSLGWAQAALGSKKIFRLWQLMLGGDRSAAGACSPSVTWEGTVAEAWGKRGGSCYLEMMG